MSSKYLINDQVYFYFKENRLVPVYGNGVPITLNTPSGRCLLLLLKRKDEIITQDEFINEVWLKRGVFTNVNTYFQNIHLIRKALKTSGIDENIIKTIPREGLKFTGRVKLIDSRESGLKEKYVESAVDTLKLEKKSHLASGFHTINTILFISISIMIILLLYASKMTISNSSKDSRLFQGYKAIGDVNGCAIQIQRVNALVINDRYLRFIEANNIKCNADEMAYISINEEIELISVIICEKNSNEIKYCESNIYTG